MIPDAYVWLLGPRAYWAGLYEHFTWHRTRAAYGEGSGKALAWRASE